MDNTRRRPLRLAGRAAAVIAAVLLVTTLATGWLYLVRPHVLGWPGPRVADALPLDELPGTDGVPLAAYLAVFAVAGGLLGLAARAARLSRLTAALSLAAGTGVWLLAADALSLFVVRQVPAAQALHDAVRVQPVYIAAALAGAGGAVLGRPGRAGGLTPRLLGWLVAGAGLADLASALVPRLGGLAWLAPPVLSPAAHILLVPSGVVLLITARGLARGSRRAWQLATGLLGLSVLLQLLRGPDYAAAILGGLLAIALVARRADFRYLGDPAARPSALARLAGLLALALLYGVAALWAYRTAAGLPFSASAALRDTLRAMAGRVPADVDLLPGEFAEWFPLSVLSIAVTGVIWAAAVWLRPWRQRLSPDRRRREQVAGLVRRWGSDTLAPFALRSDKEWFISGQTVIAYRAVRGIALVSGDPIGPPAETGPALREFLGFAQARGWRTAILGASQAGADGCRELGMHPLYHGDEAVIDPAAFSLDGRSMRATRQAVHRLQRKGYTAEVIMAGSAGPAVRAELARVEAAWLRGAPRKGFSMELDSLFGLDGADAAFVIGRDEAGRVSGFLHLAACPASHSLSLSTMPREPGTPNGFTAWLITEAVRWARDAGYGCLSLNFSPFAALLAAEADLPPARRMQRRALIRLKGALSLQLDNLLRFNAQFGPQWQHRYLVLQAWTDLPRVAVAAMAAEGYLPHATLIRGRGWAPSPALASPVPPAPDPVPPGPAPGTAPVPPAGPAAEREVHVR
jgi:lysyl-tRNA synthetase, class II